MVLSIIKAMKKWLKTKITIEEAKQTDPYSCLQFNEQLQEGDELWEFVSPPETWKHLCGRAGICIVRKGEVIDSYITKLS